MAKLHGWMVLHRYGTHDPWEFYAEARGGLDVTLYRTRDDAEHVARQVRPYKGSRRDVTVVKVEIPAGRQRP